ncbi:MAG: response regulator [Rhizomicrobium sp.]
MNCQAGSDGAGNADVWRRSGSAHGRRNGTLTGAPSISIVDDDPAVLNATRRLLRLRGFSVSSFSSAEEFLASPQAETTQCVITDVRMSGMSGVDLQARLLDQRHDLPFIFLTAFPDDATRRRALAAGAVAFLAKPFDGQTLIESVREALARK